MGRQGAQATVDLESLGRPYPGDRLLRSGDFGFEPAPGVLEWMSAHILDEDGALHNPDHVHLLSARIGVLWTTARGRVGGQDIAGQAEMPSFRGKGFVKPRQEAQLRGWFCESPWEPLPDFIITLHAGYAASASDAQFCALVEHELYHCGQAVDDFGGPRFNQATGCPIFTVRPHDVEEFVGVVERYGVGASAGAIRELVKAAQSGPTVAEADVRAACGTCGRIVA